MEGKKLFYKREWKRVQNKNKVKKQLTDKNKCAILLSVTGIINN